MAPAINIKRVYEQSEKKDGYRILVDRLWPRGMKKEDAEIDEWVKDLAPTPALRKWFGHDPELWLAFQERYHAELKKNSAVADFIKKHKNKKVLTLLYGAKDEKHNHV